MLTYLSQILSLTHRLPILFHQIPQRLIVRIYPPLLYQTIFDQRPESDRRFPSVFRL